MFLEFKFNLDWLFKPTDTQKNKKLFTFSSVDKENKNNYKFYLKQLFKWLKICVYSFSFLMISWSFFQSLFTSYVSYSREVGVGLEAGYSVIGKNKTGDLRYDTLPWTPNPWAYWPLVDSSGGFGPFIMWFVYPFSRAFLWLIWKFMGTKDSVIDKMGFNVIFAILVVLVIMKSIVFLTTLRAQYYSDKQQRHKRNIALINAKYESTGKGSEDWRQLSMLRQQEINKYNKKHKLKPLAPLENFFINTPIFLIVFRLMTITRPVKSAKLFGVMPLSNTPAHIIFSDFLSVGWMYLIMCLIIIPVNYFNQRFPTMLMKKRFPDYTADSNLSFRNVNLGSSKKIQNIMTVMFMLFSFFWSTSLAIYYFFNSLLNIFSNYCIHLILKKWKPQDSSLTRKLRVLGI